MKKKSIWSRIGDFLMGKGFYMVLLLCVMAIGGSGYYLYHLASTGLDSQNQAVSAPAEVEVETETAGSAEVNQELADAMAQAQAEAEAAAAQAASEVTESQAPETGAVQQEASDAAAGEEEPSAQEAGTEASDAQETAAQESADVQETVEPEAVAEPDAARTTFAPPVSGETVAAFSDTELTYNAALEDWRTHNGVDLAAQLGDPVSAVLDGEVLSVTNDVLLGTTITLNHGSGLRTIYSNLASDVTVEQGDAVTAGETLGSVGDTAAGEAHEGAWLHFAVEQDGVAVDPMDYLE